MLNITFLACRKVELWDLTVCIAVNRNIITCELHNYFHKAISKSNRLYNRTCYALFA